MEKTGMTTPVNIIISTSQIFQWLNSRSHQPNIRVRNPVWRVTILQIHTPSTHHWWGPISLKHVPVPGMRSASRVWCWLFRALHVMPTVRKKYIIWNPDPRLWNTPTLNLSTEHLPDFEFIPLLSRYRKISTGKKSGMDERLNMSGAGWIPGEY